VIQDQGYFSLYRVARHEYAKPPSFAVVQAEIELAIQQKRMETAKNKVMEDLRAAASVRTIFDEDSEL
jgi:hypothetical protein